MPRGVAEHMALPSQWVAGAGLPARLVAGADARVRPLVPFPVALMSGSAGTEEPLGEMAWQQAVWDARPHPPRRLLKLQSAEREQAWIQLPPLVSVL